VAVDQREHGFARAVAPLVAAIERMLAGLALGQVAVAAD
jgi:hypothetical protein